jgi:competence protein ComEC
VPGDRVRARLRLRPLVGRFDPGGADPAERLRRAGIGATGSLVHPALAVRFERGAFGRVRARLAAGRREAAARLEAAGAGLAAALALGVRSGLPPELEASLRAAGLAHLLAVSGLHLALVAGLAFGAVRRALLRLAPRALADPRRAALVAAGLAAAGYGALTGFALPVRRALVFLAAAVAGSFARRPAQPGALLAAAALAILAPSPEALFEPGAQLSFAAAGALLLARSRPREEPVARSGAPALRRRIGDALRTSAAAVAATAPLAALHFGRFAPAALAANVVAVPLTGALALPVSLAAALAALLAPSGSRLLAALALAARGSEALLLAVADRLAAGPGAERLVAVSPLALAVAGAAGLGALRARGTGLRVALAAVGHTALLLLPPPVLRPPPPRLVALDVGQGDAVLVQGRRGALLVDGGTAFEGVDLGRSVVLPALAALGVSRLDVVAASHGDLDHRGGLVAVLERIPTGRLWLPPGGRADPAFVPLLRAAARAHVAVEERAAGDPPFAAGDLRLETLWPPRAPLGLGDNDRSLVLRAEVDGVRVLLPGDVEAAAETALGTDGAALRAEVLKLAHHGSRTSSTDAFLRAVAPEVAIASAPCLGRFGMPHAEVRRRVRAAGASLWWTGRDGAVFVALARPRLALGLAPLAAPRERWRCGK